MQRRTIIIPNSEALARARVLLGLTKIDLAERANVPHSSIVRAEQGFNVAPKTATRLAEALDVPFDGLFTIQVPGTTNGAGQTQVGEKGMEVNVDG